MGRAIAIALTAVSLPLGLATGAAADKAGVAAEPHSVVIARGPARAGKLFVGFVFLRRPAADVVSVEFSCFGSIGTRRLRGVVTKYPDGEAPFAITCGWRVPAGTAGKTLRGVESYTVTRRDGNALIADGVPVRWSISR